MMDAGKYNHKIKIFKTEMIEDDAGFQTVKKTVILYAHAYIKTTKGMTLIISGSDFEKAYTNFTIRYPKTPIDRDMMIEFRGNEYTIEYLNNIDEACVELEIQAKLVKK